MDEEPVRRSDWLGGLFDSVVLTFFDGRTGVASTTLSLAAWLERFLVEWLWLSPLSDITIIPVALRDEVGVMDACVGCGAGVVLAFFVEETVTLPSLAITILRFLPVLLAEVVGVPWFKPSTASGRFDGRADTFFTLLGAGLLPIGSC